MKPPLVLLHGALGAQDQFDAVSALLAETYTLHRLNWEGHGDAPARQRPFRMEHFAETLGEYLRAQALGAADVFGYSMGGYVALYLAQTQPTVIGRVLTLGTKFDWTPETAARETRLLDADKMLAKVPAFAQALEARHTAFGWRQVLAHTAEMMTALGANPPLSLTSLAQLPHRVRIGVGDRDATVTLEESLAVYRALPQGELSVFPATPHPLEKILVTLLALSITEFFVP